MTFLAASIVLALSAGCQSARRADPRPAVDQVCPRCHGEHYEWVDYKRFGGPVTHTADYGQCACCEAALSHWLHTGQYRHACSACADPASCPMCRMKP